MRRIRRVTPYWLHSACGALPAAFPARHEPHRWQRTQPPSDGSPQAVGATDGDDDGVRLFFRFAVNEDTAAEALSALTMAAAAAHGRPPTTTMREYGDGVASTSRADQQAALAFAPVDVMPSFLDAASECFAPPVTPVLPPPGEEPATTKKRDGAIASAASPPGDLKVDNVPPPPAQKLSQFHNNPPAAMDAAPPNINGGPATATFQCSACRKTFRLQSAADAHVQSRHQGAATVVAAQVDAPLATGRSPEAANGAVPSTRLIPPRMPPSRIPPPVYPEPVQIQGQNRKTLHDAAAMIRSLSCSRLLTSGASLLAGTAHIGHQMLSDPLRDLAQQGRDEGANVKLKLEMSMVTPDAGDVATDRCATTIVLTGTVSEVVASPSADSSSLEWSQFTIDLPRDEGGGRLTVRFRGDKATDEMGADAAAPLAPSLRRGDVVFVSGQLRLCHMTSNKADGDAIFHSVPLVVVDSPDSVTVLRPAASVHA